MSVGGKTGRRDDNGQRKRFGRRLVLKAGKRKIFSACFSTDDEDGGDDDGGHAGDGDDDDAQDDDDDDDLI